MYCFLILLLGKKRISNMLIPQSTTLVEAKQHIAVSAYSPMHWKETAHYSDWTRRITSHFLAKITIQKNLRVLLTSQATKQNWIPFCSLPFPSGSNLLEKTEDCIQKASDWAVNISFSASIRSNLWSTGATTERSGGWSKTCSVIKPIVLIALFRPMKWKWEMFDAQKKHLQKIKFSSSLL